MKTSINVENIRCGGCANSITKKLTAIDGINEVEVAIEDQIVTIDSNDDSVRVLAVEALLAMGLSRARLCRRFGCTQRQG